MDAFEWAHNATDKLSTEFGSRLVFVGIQGSRARGEARDGSDIDLVVLLDHVDADDLARYHSVIQTMPHSELACGFVGSERVLAAWPRHELFPVLSRHDGDIRRAARRRAVHERRCS